jgi:ribosomal-protein-alanine N-acetyltransferase
MTAADLPAVQALDALSFSTPWPARAFAVELANPNARCWVTEIGGQVVAALVVWRVLDEAHIVTLAVHPGFRRRGVGRVLLQDAMDAAYVGGARIYHLEVRAGNIAAIGLYEGLGFQAVGRRPKYYVDTGEDALLMTRVVS